MKSYPTGLPATALVTFASAPAAGDTVTVNGTLYTYGTDFTGIDGTAMSAAAAFAACMNGDAFQFGQHNSTQPIKLYQSVQYGTAVRLIASVPGSVGNALTLTTSSGGRITVSGALFTGGIDSGVGGPQVLMYTGANPTADGLVPLNPLLTAIAVKTGGAWYSWSVATQTWG